MGETEMKRSVNLSSDPDGDVWDARVRWLLTQGLAIRVETGAGDVVLILE